MNTKLRCLLLDDELPGLTYLKVMCEQIEGVEVVKAFNDPVRFMSEAAHLDFDLAILDIQMPAVSGLEVARSLNGKPVIFISAYKEYAQDAFDIDAIDYVGKPIRKDRLEKALQKAAAQLRSGTAAKVAQLNTNKGKGLLYFDEVLRITNSETDKRDKQVILRSGEKMVLKNISFQQLLSLLPPDQFCRINKKDVISLKAVRSYRHNEVLLAVRDQAVTLPLSDNFRKEFQEKMPG